MNMLRQKEKELELFIDRIRQNIYTIDRGEHKKLLDETYHLLDEEYQGMLELKEQVERDEERIYQEQADHTMEDEAVTEALRNLALIRQNLTSVTVQQRNLIGKRFEMNDIYEETIRDSFYTAMVRRYDFQKEIMEPMEHVKGEQIESLWKLFVPLRRPRARKQLLLSMPYQPQGKLHEEETEEAAIEEDVFEEDRRFQEQRRRDFIHVKLMERMFSYGKDHPVFTFSEFYQYLNQHAEKPEIYTEEKRIFLVMLKLYDYKKIDLGEWRQREDKEIPEANGEFDLSYCLYQMELEHPDFYGIQSLSFEKNGEKFQTEIEESRKEQDGMTEKQLKRIIMDEIKVTIQKRESEDKADVEKSSGNFS